MDARILQLIKESLFERELYEAAVFNLEDRRNKLRFHNFAFAMRELAGHTLARLAPDEDVQRCIWWKKKAKGTVPQVTRIERCVYATQGGLSNFYVQKKLGLDFSGDYETLRDAVIRLSEYVHITPEVFELSDEDIDQLAQDTVEALGRLMGCINECRKAIADRLSESITDAAIQQVLGESLDAVDELATHYYVEEVEVDSHDVTGITADAVQISASGSIGVTLQWGSNSDLRNGDGAEMVQSFSFTCELICATPNPDPDMLEYVVDSVLVDTSDWYSEQDEANDVIGSEDIDDNPLSADDSNARF